MQRLMRLPTTVVRDVLLLAALAREGSRREEVCNVQPCSLFEGGSRFKQTFNIVDSNIGRGIVSMPLTNS